MPDLRRQISYYWVGPASRVPDWRCSISCWVNVRASSRCARVRQTLLLKFVPVTCSLRQINSLGSLSLAVLAATVSPASATPTGALSTSDWEAQLASNKTANTMKNLEKILITYLFCANSVEQKQSRIHLLYFICQNLV